jgi:hypothetical protein
VKLSKSGALFLSLSHTHSQRAARDDDFSPYSFFLVRVFACVCEREISYSAGKFFMVKFVKTSGEKFERGASLA